MFDVRCSMFDVRCSISHYFIPLSSTAFPFGAGTIPLTTNFPSEVSETLSPSQDTKHHPNATTPAPIIHLRNLNPIVFINSTSAQFHQSWLSSC
jgi:hypothetical protein